MGRGQRFRLTINYDDSNMPMLPEYELKLAVFEALNRIQNANIKDAQVKLIEEWDVKEDG